MNKRYAFGLLAACLASSAFAAPAGAGTNPTIPLLDDLAKLAGLATPADLAALAYFRPRPPVPRAGAARQRAAAPAFPRLDAPNLTKTHFTSRNRLSIRLK